MSRERDRAIRIHSADRGFKADDATEGSGDADGATSVRADAAETETGGNGGRGSSAGAARDARKIPGLMAGAVLGGVGSHAQREFLHFCFSCVTDARLINATHSRSL